MLKTWEVGGWNLNEGKNCIRYLSERDDPLPSHDLTTTEMFILVKLILLPTFEIFNLKLFTSEIFFIEVVQMIYNFMCI